jgi:hypothetical protein
MFARLYMQLGFQHPPQRVGCERNLIIQTCFQEKAKNLLLSASCVYRIPNTHNNNKATVHVGHSPHARSKSDRFDGGLVPHSRENIT